MSVRCGKIMLDGGGIGVRVAVRIVAALSLVLALQAVPLSAEPTCTLSPVFSLFRQAVGPDTFGDCAEPVTIADNGDITQPTTRGLAVFRRADQVLAFTDGQTTWLYGPQGLQSRANGARFPWEPAEASAPSPTVVDAPVIVSPPTKAAATIPTATAAAAVQTVQTTGLTPQLSARCSRIAQREWSTLATGQRANANGANLNGAIRYSQTQCESAAAMYGERGVDCYESALRDGLAQGRRSGNGEATLVLVNTLFDACVR